MDPAPAKPDLHTEPVPNPEPVAPNGPAPGSRVVALERSNLFLYLTLLFVAANIVLPKWIAFGFLAVLLVFLTGVLVCHRRPQNFPAWFRPLSDNFQARLKENPPEIFLIFGIIFLSLCNSLALSGPHYDFRHRLREALSVILVTAAFLINQYRRPHDFGRRSVWDVFSKEPPQVRVRHPPPPDPGAPVEPASPATQSQVLRADLRRRQWDEKQRARWESWMNEEVGRLNDDRRQNKNPPPPAAD